MKRIVAATAVTLALSGCASIFNGKTQAVILNSVPDGAVATVSNRAGEKVHTGTTPVTLTLNRGAGYFKSETYTVTLTKDGFATKQLTIASSVSGWYIGNLLFGGLIGMLAVDPVTGAMYTFPDSVNETLDASTAAAPGAVGSITIVSTDSLSAEQMQRAQRWVPATVAQ